MNKPTAWVGHGMTRVEDGRLIRGQGHFIADGNPLPGIRSAAILRSPYAHARILRIDCTAARRLPGVIGIVTGDDLRDDLAPFPVGVSVPVQYYPLALSTVRYVGEPVAVVVAESRYVAEDALEHIHVDYAPLPVVWDVEAAVNAPPAALHDGIPHNVANHRQFNYGQPVQELAASQWVVHERFVYPRTTGLPIETYGVLASYDASTQDYTVWSNFHGPFTLHSVMAQALKTRTHKLRLQVPPDIGGSFGVKSAVYPYIVLMAATSKRLGCPVQWIEDRLEHLKASSSASSRITYATMGLTAEGRIRALQLLQYDEVGAYIRAPEPATLYRVHGNLTGAYDIRHLSVENYAVMTNRVPTGLVRGYGGPQLYFALERLMDIAAHTMGLSPVEIRRRNLIAANAFPYTTPSGGRYDSGNYPAVLDDALETAHYDEFVRQIPEKNTDQVRYGIGIAAVVEPSGSNMGYVSVAFTPEERAHQLPKSGATAAATVAMDALGGITVRLDTTPSGQGHETVAQQIVAEVLGVSPHEVRVIAEMDTATSAWSIASGSYSSRFAVAGASAIYGAALKVREKLLHLAAHILQVDRERITVREGHLWLGEQASALTMKRLAGLTHWNPAALPPGMEPGVYETYYFNAPHIDAPTDDDRVNSSVAYGFLVDVVKVAVHLETGMVEILDYTTVHDAGTVLNPLLAQGQIYGGLAFGIGSALYEELIYDTDGQLVTGSLMDYLVPTAHEMPQTIHSAYHETPSPLTPLGAKGMGEGNVMSAGAALANAVSHALGQEIHRLPITPQAIYDLQHPARRHEVNS